MNILKRYCLKISDFSYSDIFKIINDKHDKYTLKRKAPQLFFIEDKNTGKLVQLKCISQSFTTEKEGKAVRIPKTNSKCYHTQLKLGIKAHDCDICYKRVLELFDKNELYITKNGK